MISYNLQNKITNFSAILLSLIPLFLISGPFIPDLFLVIINLNFILLTCVNRDFKIFRNKILLLALIFCLIISLVSILSLNISSIKSSFFYFRFIFFALATYKIVSKKKNIFKYILGLFLFIYPVLFFDSIYQYHFLENIIGLKYMNMSNFRITSFFGDDEILGAYISRFFPFLLFLVIYNFKDKNLKKKIIITILTVFSFVMIILSGERTAFALFVLSILFIFFSSIKLRKILILPMFVSLLVFVSVILSSEKIRFRMVDTTLVQLGLANQSERLVLFSKTYEGHYIISLNMFKEKPFLGHGAKMFRFYCAKKENFVAINACTTHPHNFYAQMLAETGIIGFTLLISIFTYISYMFLKNFYYQFKYKKQLISDFGVCLLASYFITLFPILPSGNFFNNWLSIIIYYPLGFLIYIIKEKKFYV